MSSKEHKFSIPLAVGVCITVTAAGLSYGVLQSRRSKPSDLTCPAGYKAIPEQAFAILGAVNRTASGRQLVKATQPVLLCFGRPHVPSVMTSKIVLMDERLETVESAARLTHLLMHLVRGEPLPKSAIGHTPCPALVKRAVLKEAEALGAEAALRDALGVTNPGVRYGFEPKVYALPKARRVAFIAEYLFSHPSGDGALIGYVDLFTAQCRDGMHPAAR